MHVYPVYGVSHVLEYRIERHQQITTAHSSFFSINVEKVTFNYAKYIEIFLIFTQNRL